MLPVASLEQYQDMLQRVRAGASNYVTNFYATPKQIETWIERKVLFVIIRPTALLLLRRDRDFYHLSHVAADREALCDALGTIETIEATTLVTDLVGPNDDIARWAEVYQQQGFVPHRALTRMTRTIRADPTESGIDNDLTFAKPKDAAALLNFLERLLDPLTEQIPDLFDLETWCGLEQVLVVWKNDGIGGLLIYERTGLSCVLRYWFVDDSARNCGIGAKLIRRFFRLCRDCQRTTLWVISDNDDSIAKYEHYGFRRDNLSDQIMLRPVLKESFSENRS